MKSLKDVLTNLIGEQLSAATFVQDYLQVDFNGHRLTVFVPMEVRARGLAWVSGHPDFRNQLCDLIGESVAAVDCRPEQLILSFAEARDICISLHDDVYVGPEAITFQPRNESGLWVI